MMRKVLNTVNMDGVIVIGEGEKDEVILLICTSRSTQMPWHSSATTAVPLHV